MTDIRQEMVREIAGYSDGDLERELTFARSFGPDIHEYAPMWLEVLTQEQDRRTHLT